MLVVYDWKLIDSTAVLYWTHSEQISTDTDTPLRKYEKN